MDFSKLNTSKKEVQHIIDKGNKERSVRKQKQALQRRTKFAPKVQEPLKVMPPVVNNNRKLFNEESAILGNCAKIIPRTEVVEEVPISKRQAKKERAKLAANNFGPLPILPDLDFHTRKTELQEVCDALFRQVMGYARCYYCRSSNVNYVRDDDYWAYLYCRSCQSDFNYHPRHGYVSSASRYAIINPINNVGGHVVIDMPEEEKKLTLPIEINNVGGHIIIDIPEEEKKPILPVISPIRDIKKRQIVFDNSHIKLGKESKLDAIVKLPFVKQKKIVNNGMRPVNTIPVYETLSYANALKNPKQEIDILKNVVIDEEDQEHQVMFKRIKRKFFIVNQILFDKWNKHKIDKRYKNPYLGNAKDFLTRFNEEPSSKMESAFNEWMLCARTFGVVSGKITSDWSE